MGGLLKSSAEPGLLDALRRAGGTLVEIGSIRAGLFAVELREEIERGKRWLLLAACAAALLHFAVLLAIVLVAVVFWDTYRVTSIAVMALACLAACAAFLRVLRAELSAKPAPFAASRAELEQDMRDLRLYP